MAIAVCGYVISSQTKYPEECWKFVEFMTGPAGQRINGKLSLAYPSLKEMALIDEFINDEFLRKSFNCYRP